MTVADLIRELQALPGHWPVHVEATADGSGGGADKEYHYVLDVQRGNFPSRGCMAVIRTALAGEVR